MIKQMTRTTLAIAMAMLGLAACEPQEQTPLSISGIELRMPAEGVAMGAAWFSLSNNSDEVQSITEVTSPQFGSVEMHETIMDGDIARMRKLTGIELAPGETNIFEKGGRHLMLMKPTGAADVVTLRFWDGETLLLSVDTPVSDD